MTYCTVKGCHNASHYHNNNKDNKITFHAFPLNPIVATQWTQKIRLNRREECWKPTKHTRVCSEHFDESEKYTTKGGLCKLRLGVVPTKGLHIYCQDDSQCSNSRHLNKKPLGASSNEAKINSPRINCNNIETLKTISQKNDSDIDSIYDSPRINCNEENFSLETISQKNALMPLEYKLRKQLARKSALQHKQSKKLKLLQQKIRCFKEKNMYLLKILHDLKNKQFKDNECCQFVVRKCLCSAIVQKPG